MLMINDCTVEAAFELPWKMKIGIVRGDSNPTYPTLDNTDGVLTGETQGVRLRITPSPDQQWPLHIELGTNGAEEIQLYLLLEGVQHAVLPGDRKLESVGYGAGGGTGGLGVPFVGLGGEDTVVGFYWDCLVHHPVALRKDQEGLLLVGKHIGHLDKPFRMRFGFSEGSSFDAAFRSHAEGFPHWYGAVGGVDLSEGNWWYAGAEDNTGLMASVAEKRHLLGPQRVRFYQIHCYFPKYGVYQTQEEVWRDIYGRETAVEQLRGVMGWCRQEGITPFLYFNATECQWQYAEEHLSDSIACDEKGSPIKTWWVEGNPREHTYLMNPDPAYGFGAFVLRQVQLAIERYPDLGGIFVDRADYRHIDYAHAAPGISVGGKTAYPISVGVDKLLTAIKRLCRDAGKYLVVNVPSGVETARHGDGLTLDAVFPWVVQARYMAWNKPVWWLTYPVTKKTVEKAMAYRLRLGADWELNLPEEDWDAVAAQ